MLRKKGLVALLATVFMVLVIGISGMVRFSGLYQELTFYRTERTETELKVKSYAEEMGIFYSEYPQSLIELLERNPETEAFVLGYPFREELTIDGDELMERFVRGDASRKSEGSGLGLNIAKSLMEVQGGDMQLLLDGDLFKVTLIFPADN